MTGKDTTIESVAQYADEMGAEEARVKMAAFLQQQRDLRDGSRGQWVPPPTHPHLKPPAYRIYRLGSLTDVRRKAVIEANLYVLLAQGFRRCPAGMRYVPCPLEGDYGVYVYIEEPLALQRDEYEDEARRKIEATRLGKRSQDLDDLSRLAGVHIDGVTVKQGKMSVEEFRAGKRR